MEKDTTREDLAFQKGYIQGFKEGLIFKKENNITPDSGTCTFCGEIIFGNYHVCPRKQRIPNNPYGPVTC